MSSSTPPPPPPSMPPSMPPSPSARRTLPWIVAGGLVVVIAVVVVLVVTLTGSKEAREARSVQDVADIAVDAAEDLDVDAGVDLLCEAPSSAQRAQLEQLIEDGQERAATDDPDVDYEISEVEGDATGSFVVRISSDANGLEDADLELRIIVEQRGERSCIGNLGS